MHLGIPWDLRIIYRSCTGLTSCWPACVPEGMPLLGARGRHTIKEQAGRHPPPNTGAPSSPLYPALSLPHWVRGSLSCLPSIPGVGAPSSPLLHVFFLCRWVGALLYIPPWGWGSVEPSASLTPSLSPSLPSSPPLSWGPPVLPPSLWGLRSSLLSSGTSGRRSHPWFESSGPPSLRASGPLPPSLSWAFFLSRSWTGGPGQHRLRFRTRQIIGG